MAGESINTLPFGVIINNSFFSGKRKCREWFAHHIGDHPTLGAVQVPSWTNGVQHIKDGINDAMASNYCGPISVSELFSNDLPLFFDQVCVIIGFHTP